MAIDYRGEYLPVEVPAHRVMLESKGVYLCELLRGGFAVVYGLQVKTFTSIADAAIEFEANVRHSEACHSF